MMIISAATTQQKSGLNDWKSSLTSIHLVTRHPLHQSSDRTISVPPKLVQILCSILLSSLYSKQIWGPILFQVRIPDT